LPELKATYQPRFVIANGENAAAGVGITPDIADDLLSWGVDAITLGNHAFHKREIYPYFELSKPIIRPANLPLGTPGMGRCQIERDGTLLAVYNLSGRVFLDGYDDPFAKVDSLLKLEATPHIFVDFHAEATSEKVAMAWHLDGRVSAVVGTHTHVTTADERILPHGTAAITDVGMCGPENGVIGMDRATILKRFRTSLPQKFEVANGVGVISGVVIDVEMDTGRAVAISRVRIAPENS
jgi:metallophosphoesterase (TIGR00282 family)